MQKVMVIGCCGAGKSTFSKKLQERTGLQLIHLDQEYWHPNWQETPKELWEKNVQELVLQPNWIMDGNYSGTLDIRIREADTLIYLDYPTMTCLWRVLKRSLRHWHKERPDMAEGCNERFNWAFFYYVATYNQTRRTALLNKLKQINKKEIYIFRNDREADDFLTQIKEGLI
jgi:adenylate kinase family enzyme